VLPELLQDPWQSTSPTQPWGGISHPDWGPQTWAQKPPHVLGRNSAARGIKSEEVRLTTQ